MEAFPAQDRLLFDPPAELRKLQDGYRRINLSTDRERGETAESYCEKILNRLQAEAGSGEAFEAALQTARQKHSRSSLIHVLTAQYLWSNHRFDEAALHARTAIALDQLDLHAQRLLAAAVERSTELVSETDRWLKDRFCSRPFESLETRANGEIGLCCAAWLPAPVGRVDSASAEQIWNSEAAREIRRSILDGDYRYCSRMYCQKIANRELPRRTEVNALPQRAIISTRDTRLDRGPREVVLSHDRTCNLSCPSCRTSLFVEKKSKQDRLNAIAETVLLPLLLHAEQVQITGSGDPFASHHFRHLITKLDAPRFSKLRLRLQTNGLLLDEEAWTDLRLDGRVDSIWISIDAAHADTYERLRRGGSFERLLRNLEFVSRLRRERRFRFLRLDTVVQWLNYREIPEIISLGQRLGADRISFQMLRNWGTFTVAEFGRHNIGDPCHPEFDGFLEVLRHPSVASPRVGLSTVRPYFDLARKGTAAERSRQPAL